MNIQAIILLYLLGVGFLVAEAFLPGAIVGVIGGLILIYSIYMGFAVQGTIFGIVQLAVALVLLPTVFLFALKKLSLKKSLNQSEGFTVEKENIQQFMEQAGTTLTKLRPSGIALINHKKVDVVTEGEMIEKDIPVKVIKIEGNRVIVRLLESR